MFEAIHPYTLLQAKDEELHQAAQRLSEHYSRDIAPSFPEQLLSIFRTCFRDQIQKQNSAADLAKMPIVNHTAESTFRFARPLCYLCYFSLSPSPLRLPSARFLK